MRRVRVFGLLAALPLVLTSCTWAMFGSGPERTRFNPVVASLKTSNVGSLTLQGTGLTQGGVESSPAVVNGVVYVGSGDGKLYAFDERGQESCTGSPRTCAPLWTAAANTFISSPAVANGVVYIGSFDKKLYAYDAAGTAGCSGTPKTCAPLWSGTANDPTSASSPAVANGVVYISAGRNLYAFDAGGSTGCSGTPKACQPLWTAAAGGGDFNFSSPTIANGVVYIGSTDGNLYAFDAGGATGCSGTPKTCQPLWTTAATGGPMSFSSPAVANGRVYVGASDDGKLYAFDAAGTAGCSGTPKRCAPLWTGPTGGYIYSSPAVASGVVYIGSKDGKLYALDADGARGCSGTPKSCAPLWTGATGGQIFVSSPAVENGVVFVGSEDKKLYAFDAAGTLKCSGTPKTCTPLWTGATGFGVYSSPAPAGNAVFVGSGNSLYAFAL